MQARAWRLWPALCLALVACATAWVQVRSYDVWWHIEAGEWILGHRAVPRVDDFSFTSEGVAWIDHEWLSQIVLYVAHAWGGVTGLIMVKAACALVVALSGFVHLRRCGARAPAAVIVVCAALAGMRFRLTERPDAISLAMAAAVAALVFDPIGRPSDAARRLALPAIITAVWANLHAGALIAPAIAVCAALGALLEPARDASSSGRLGRPEVRYAFAAVALCGLALLLNPYGAKIWAVPAQISGALDPTNLLNPEWQAPSWRQFPMFFMAVILLALLAMRSVLRKESGATGRVLLVILTGGLAMTSARHIGIFFALLPVMVAPGILRGSGERWAGAAAGTFALVTAGLMVVFPPAGARSGPGLMEGRFPVGAAAFVESHLPDARMYNDVAFGGYLIWRGYPQRRVFIDGRNEVHAALLRELSEALDDGRRWETLLAKYGVDAAMVSYRPEPVAVRKAGDDALSLSTFSELHFPRPAWALVYWDDVAMVFVRRDGAGSELAARYEYRWVRPEAWRQKTPTVGLEGMGPESAAEVERRLAEDPECRLAKTLARVYREGGRQGR